jgi:hypothetical protein
MESKARAAVYHSHTFSTLALREFRGHPFGLVFETLRSKGFPVRARDGLLIPEPGFVLKVEADADTVTYRVSGFIESLAGQLDDGV